MSLRDGERNPNGGAMEPQLERFFLILRKHRTGGLMVRKRRRGTAIVDTPNGILVVSKDGRTFLTPGGRRPTPRERQDAAIRELMEETGLKVVDIAFLFEFTGRIHRDTR
jgi:8-oxo-dGTP pyrophosphatase MutT (NUDIX family)